MSTKGGTRRRCQPLLAGNFDGDAETADEIAERLAERLVANRPLAPDHTTAVVRL
jgi:hypothetical protein